MRKSSDHGNLLARIGSAPDLARAGLKAELVGRRSIKISRAGRLVGIWREGVGSFEWYPAGHSQPQHRVPTPEEVIRHLSGTIGSG
jgi:hypothetical protein